LGVAGAFVLLFALLMPTLLGRDTTRDHSAFRKNRWGCAALVELCGRAQPRLRAVTLTAPLDDLAEVRGPLLILDPERPFSSSELDAVVEWVESGGVLIVAIEGLLDDPSALNPLSEPPYAGLATALGVEVAENRDGVLAEAEPAADSQVTEDVRRIAIDTSYFLGAALGETPGEERRITAELIPELTSNGRTILASFKHGEGEVFVSSEAGIFANGMLGREDNLQLAANLLWPRATEGVVYFDEYHHGFGARAPSGAAPGPAPLHRALLVVLVGFATFLAGKAARFGAPLRVFDPRRRAAMEYVEALAGLFRRGEANEWALQKTATAFRHRLSAAVGLPATTDAEVLATTLAERRHVPTSESTPLLNDIEGALAEGGVGGRRLAELVGRMADLEGLISDRHHLPPAPATRERAVNGACHSREAAR